MRVAVTANGKDLDAPASPIFGRAPVYVFVDSETMEFEAVDNPAINAPGGAGIQAAQFVVERGAEAVITGNVGPNAFNVLRAAGVAVYPFAGGTVRQAVEAFRQGQLVATGGATGPQHAGMGMGMGMGRGRGMGMGRAAAMSAGPAAPAPPAGPAPSREAEIADLKRTAADLRQRLAEVIDRIDRLQKEE
jgi:predicted Fe-Mo cluster-binding NifX family protein